ncbi:MAG: hypothetical protein HCTKY_4350 [Candidatus Hepatoplasma crinochetorum]|nr:MAG: hypothetical protein HCTKY_4350 [Candidatus Hepatoplasma crinochetorum]
MKLRKFKNFKKNKENNKNYKIMKMKKNYQIGAAAYVMIALSVFLLIFIFFYLLFAFIIKRHDRKQLKEDEKKYLDNNFDMKDKNE